VRLWNPATGRPVGVLRTGTGPYGGVHVVAFSPDGKLLAAGCGDGTVRLWNPATSRPIATLHATTNNVYGVHAVAFSPNGKLLATGEGDATVRAWNTATRHPVGAPIQTGSGPADALSVVAFSPNGKQLAGGSNDGVAQLCADVGPPTPQEWNHYASGEPLPKVCA
jgi:WD40 repeat protein